MKQTLLLLLSVLFLAGCAQEVIYADHEFGMATNDAFSKQIINKDYKYATKPVEQMEGLYSEHIMGSYLGTYIEGFTKEDIEIGKSGLVE